jgi:hypothetical protein
MSVEIDNQRREAIIARNIAAVEQHFEKAQVVSRGSYHAGTAGRK